ncbi:MAG: hypothetical protein IJZ23_10260 [Roseburia sp.]|nr:hypothetical protein [Roseburia sp.]
MAELDDKVIQLILKKLNNTTLLYALSGASGKICVRFLENVSGRMLSFLDYHLEKMNVGIEKIECAQNAILQITSFVDPD